MSKAAEAMPIFNNWEQPPLEGMPELPYEPELPFEDALFNTPYEDRLLFMDNLHDKLHSGKITELEFDVFARLALPEHFEQAA